MNKIFLSLTILFFVTMSLQAREIIQGTDSQKGNVTAGTSAWAQQKNIIGISILSDIFYERSLGNLSGIGIGLGVLEEVQFNLYPQSHSPNGFYVGAGLGISVSPFITEIIEAHAGYRWMWNSGFTIGLGIDGEISTQINSSYYPLILPVLTIGYAF